MTSAVVHRNGKSRSASSGFQPWPWAIGGIFVLFAAIQLGLITLVSQGFEGPDDLQYYRHGLEYGQVIRQQQRQEELGWSLVTNLPEALPGGRAFPLQVALKDAKGGPLAGARVDLKAGRPATQRDDQRLTLAETAPGVYVTSLTVAGGVWDLTFTVRHGSETVVEKLRTSAR